MIIDTNPEFGLELTLVIPYAYWLHQRGELEKVITSKGMKPFYYFCDNVEEKYEHRTIDNKSAGLNTIPNNWIHHNAIGVLGKGYSELNDEDKTKINGVLDYRKWVPPLYKEVYNKNIDLGKPIILVSNRYNIEHGHPPIGFFDVECLYNIFNYLTKKGYLVVYKRPKNNEFPLDTNEMNSLNQGFHNIESQVEDQGLISDYDLVGYYDDVILMDDLIKDHYKNKIEVNDYNTFQLNLFSNVEGFITMGGGSSLLCSYFGKTNISYFTTNTECSRPGYFGEDNYYRKLSNHSFYPILDSEHDINKRGGRDYTELLKRIKKEF
jgi:hypothetical protein